MAIGNGFINISKQYLRVMFVIAAVFSMFVSANRHQDRGNITEFIKCQPPSPLLSALSLFGHNNINFVLNPIRYN